jgi:hypothetical protein
MTPFKEPVITGRVITGKIVFKEDVELKKDSRIYVSIRLDGAQGGIIRQAVVSFIPRKVVKDDHIPFKIETFQLHLNKKYILNAYIDIAHEVDDQGKQIVNDCDMLSYASPEIETDVDQYVLKVLSVATLKNEKFT